jgi:rhodanese-related sulfurtransferase
VPGWVFLALGALILLVVLVNAIQPAAAPVSAGAALPREISVAEAAEKRAEGAFMLDVREQDEWDQVHIPDVTLIPLGQLSTRLSEVPKDQEVVVVCRSGNRSAQARDILLQAGFTQVTSMAGGMNDWQAQGLPTASATQ